jgi:GNAT superfamily N-acetyltransferase
MNTVVREASAADISSVSEVVQTGFIAHVAPDWELSAQQDFLRDTTAEKLVASFSTATFVAVCEREDRVLGVIAMSRPNLVQLFFVAPGHLRTGIGRSLWEAARSHIEQQYPDVKTVELNSTPYAVPAYRALGFFPISEPFRRKGAVATRMACWLPGRALVQAQNAV